MHELEHLSTRYCMASRQASVSDELASTQPALTAIRNMAVFVRVDTPSPTSSSNTQAVTLKLCVLVPDGDRNHPRPFWFMAFCFGLRLTAFHVSVRLLTPSRPASVVLYSFGAPTWLKLCSHCTESTCIVKTCDHTSGKYRFCE